MPERGHGAVGRAFLTGMPALRAKAASEPGSGGAVLLEPRCNRIEPARSAHPRTHHAHTAAAYF